jgi:SAP domain-containing ribonucleoprotein
MMDPKKLKGAYRLRLKGLAICLSLRAGFCLNDTLISNLSALCSEVPELRAELEKRGLSPEGKKPDLVSRLQSRLDEEEFGLVPTGGAESSPPSAAAAAPAAASATETPYDESSFEAPPTKKTGGTRADPPPDKPSVARLAEPAVDSLSGSELAASGSGSVNLKPKADVLTFEEKKKLRTERFGTLDASAEELEKRKKRAQRFGPVSVPEKAEKPSKKAKKTDEKPLLSKEEIEKQLERLKKFGGDEARENELKAMLRKYRFETKG